MAQAMVAQSIDPTLTTLAGAMRIQFAQEPAAVRCIDRAVDHLASGLAHEFDGVELRITSWSRRGMGMIQVTDGIGCTCESNRRPWCWHRAAFRLMLAAMALSQPALLRARIIEQVSPLDIEPEAEGAYDSYGDFLQDLPPLVAPSRELTPTAGSRFARAQDAADALWA